MPSAGKTASSGDRTRAYRARLRRQGLRPVTLWLPDTRTAAFKEQAACEARARFSCWSAIGPPPITWVLVQSDQ